jgi:hypothetical protein
MENQKQHSKWTEYIINERWELEKARIDNDNIKKTNDYSWFIDYNIFNEYRDMSYENLVNNYGKEAVDARLNNWSKLSKTLLNNSALVKNHNNTENQTKENK